MWAIISQLCSVYTGIMNFLYWEVYDEICDIFTESLILSIITKLILMGFFFALSIYLLNKEDELDNVEANMPIAPTSPPISPVTPSPPRPDPLVPALYPPPYDFPFEHFRGTGDSFAPSRQNLHVERPRHIPPVSYKGSAFLETMEDVKRPDEGVSVVAEDAEPLHEEVEEAQLCPSTPSPPPKESGLSSLPEMASTQIPPQTPLQTPRLPEPPSPRTIRVNALNRVAQEEHKIQEQMVTFLHTIPTGSGYELSACLILNLLCEAKEYLEPLFPDGLSGIPTGYLVWGQSIVDFWGALSPYGWDFLHHPDSRMPEFIRRYRNLTIWFGVEELLSEFLFVPPSIPEPEPVPAPVPVPEPVSEPVLTIAEAKPQLQEQTAVAQVSSFAAPPPPQPEHSAPQSDPAPKTLTYTMSSIPANFSYRKPSQKSDPPPPPPPSPPPPPQQKQPAPFSFQYIILSTPVNTSSRRSNRTSKSLLTRSSRPAPPPPPQKQPAEPPKPTPVDPNAIDFTDPKWSTKPTPELLTLTWRSFSFPTPHAAALKIWGHSTMGRLSLPSPHTDLLSSPYIKSHLEAAALDFKRAAAILRLQTLDCEKPCEDDLGMSPLFGEVMQLIVQAAEFTERCDELAEWYVEDRWYHACVFFRDAVVQDARVWERLCGYYGQGKYKPLMKAWRQGSGEWLRIDEKYPDVEI